MPKNPKPKQKDESDFEEFDTEATPVQELVQVQEKLEEKVVIDNTAKEAPVKQVKDFEVWTFMTNSGELRHGRYDKIIQMGYKPLNKL